jgi:hypothetical protein
MTVFKTLKELQVRIQQCKRNHMAALFNFRWGLYFNFYKNIKNTECIVLKKYSFKK